MLFMLALANVLCWYWLTLKKDGELSGMEKLPNMRNHQELMSIFFVACCLMMDYWCLNCPTTLNFNIFPLAIVFVQGALCNEKLWLEEGICFQIAILCHPECTPNLTPAQVSML